MRKLAHIVVALLFWLALAGMWVRLVAEHKATIPAFRNTLFELAALAGVLLAITTWWIRHNVGIYRRKGPRRGRMDVPPDTTRDRLGRRVRWALPGGPQAARVEPLLVVEVDGDVKIYRRGD
jgi:hypothetical protein